MADRTREQMETLARELERRKQEHRTGVHGTRRWRWVLRRVVLVLAFAFLSLGGIFVVNFLRLNTDLIEGHIRSGVIPNITRGTIPLEVGRISGDLFHGIELENLRVQNPHFRAGGVMVSIPRVSLRYSLLDVFWGNLVIQRVLVQDPVLILDRAADGRLIWDFSVPGAAPASSPRPIVGKGAKWQAEERAQALADRYLADVEIRNFSLLAPRPRDLLPDQTLAHLLRLPPGNLQMSGITISLKKFPHQDFTSHILRVTTPADPTFLTFQVSRSRAAGDLAVSIDVARQNLQLAVQNLGPAGRKVLFYDGRNKDRLNVSFGLNREGTWALNRIKGLNGNIAFEGLGPLLALLPEGATATGRLALSFQAPLETPLLGTHLEGTLDGVHLAVASYPEIRSAAGHVSLQGGKGVIDRSLIVMDGLVASQSGTFVLAESGQLHATCTTVVNGDPMDLAATVARLGSGALDLALRLTRPTGWVGARVLRQVQRGSVFYRNLEVSAAVQAGTRVWDVIPQRALPGHLFRMLQGFFSRLDLTGPMRLEGRVADSRRPEDGILEFDLDGAELISGTNPTDRLKLGGRLRMAERRAELASLSFQLDSLLVEAGGTLVFAPDRPGVASYGVVLSGRLVGGKPLVITGTRFHQSLGLAGRPWFQSLELEGRDLLTARLGTDLPEQTATLKLGKLRLKRTARSWWVDDLAFTARTTQCPRNRKFRPADLKTELTARLFGFPFTVLAELDLAKASLTRLTATLKGTDFAPLLAASREIPAAAAFLDRTSLGITGAFTLEITGEGRLNGPRLQGNLDSSHLRITSREAEADLPFHLMVKTPAEGDYLGELSTRKAGITVRGTAFPLEACRGTFSWKKPAGGRERVLSGEMTSTVFDSSWKATAAYQPRSGRFSRFDLTGQTTRVETLMREIQRIGKFSIPFTIEGKAETAWKGSGQPASPVGSGRLEFANLALHFPLRGWSRKDAVLDLERITGKVLLTRPEEGTVTVSIPQATAGFLGSTLELSASATVPAQGRGGPTLDRLEARVSGLSLARGYAFLGRGFLSEQGIGLRDVVGSLTGSVSLTGAQGRYGGSGEAVLSGGGFALAAWKEPVRDLAARLSFARRGTNPVPVVQVTDLRGTFGRSRVSVPSGKITDPQGQALIAFAGRVEEAWPTDVLALLAGLRLPSISFPKEGSLAGSITLGGSLAKPKVALTVEGQPMEVRYQSDANTYAVPIGKTSLALSYDAANGQASLTKADLGLLNGTVQFDEARATLAGPRPTAFKVAGKLSGIDLGSVVVGGRSGVKGILGGTFKAEQTANGSRDAEFQLGFENFLIERIPLDPQMIEQIGLEFLERPDFRVGKLNLYLSSEEEGEDRGRVRVADGLFAGPELRLEIVNSEFNPRELQLAGKIMLNPQPLRHTTLGRKVGHWSKLVQDKATGIPYLDISVSGSWDNPKMLGKAIMDKAKKRAKKNFFRSIFGGNRAHKASVEELKQWFPGWTKQ